MIFIPTNGYLYVRLLEKKTDKVKRESKVLIPEDAEFEEDKTPHVVVEYIAGSAYDLFPELGPGQLIVVNRAGLEQVKFDGNTYDVVHRSHAVGYFKKPQ